MEKRTRNCIICNAPITRRATYCLSHSNKKTKTGRTFIMSEQGKLNIKMARQKYFANGGTSPSKGKKMSIEQKEKISKTMIERKVNVKEKNPNWKGYNYIKDLDNAIRMITEYKLWRIQVLKKDDYTCQECYHRGKPLEVHHIKEFVILLHEFLQQYNQFSPIEDKETLIRLSITYEPFWDVNNGKTLCKKCHNKTKYLNQLNNKK